MSSPRSSRLRRRLSLIASAPLVVGAIASSGPADAQVADRPALEVRSFVNGTSSKTPPGPTLPALETMEYRSVVTNTGNVDLTDFWAGGFVDGKGTGQGFCPFVNELAVGESIECGINTSAPRNRFEHQFRTRVRAVGAGITIFDNDIAYFLVAEGPGIEVIQSSNGRDSQGSFVELPQGRVVWDYMVKNVGIATLTDVKVIDPVFGVIPCPTTTLAVDASMRCQSRRIDIEELGIFPDTDDLDWPWTRVSAVGDGRVVDHVWFTGFRIVESDAAIKVDSFVNGIPVKRAATTKFALGDLVEFTYKVRNRGDSTVTDIVLDDVANGTATCDGDRIEPGGFINCVSDRGVEKLQTVGDFRAIAAAVAQSDAVSVYSQQTMRFTVLERYE